MGSVDRKILPYLKHVEAVYAESCTCPAESWALCGGQYEGHYDAACPLHGPGRRGSVRSHFPAGCPAH